jgi:Tfp pilus assembly protein PilF
VTRDAPEDYRGWLGLAALQTGAEARTAVDRAISLAPQQPSAWMARARHEWSAGERAAALKSAEQALRLRPTSLPLLAGYAEMLSLEGRCDEAHEIVRRAVGLESADADATSRLNQIASSCQAGERR